MGGRLVDLMDWEEGRFVFKFVFRLVFWAQFRYEFWNVLCLGKYFSSNNLANETQRSKVAGYLNGHLRWHQAEHKTDLGC